MSKQAFDFGNIGLGMLAANSFTRDVTGHLVQLQGDSQALLASHLTIALNLLLQCRGCIHGLLINQISADDNSAAYRLERDF